MGIEVPDYRASHQLTTAQRISRFAIRTYARWLVFLRCQVAVSGLEYLPTDGPVLLAARHYHHLYDAAILLATLPRSLHFLVALDWAQTPRDRLMLERACQLAVWPGLLRPDRLPAAANTDPSIWQPQEIDVYARRSVAESVNLLLAGRALVVFPEGSPAIDPERRARPATSMLPFQSGFVTITRLAAGLGKQPVPIVPVGLAYRRAGALWHVQVRLGPPMLVDAHAGRGETVRTVEAAVRELSGLTGG